MAKEQKEKFIVDKKKILDALKDLPEHAGIDHALYKLDVLNGIEKSMNDPRPGTPHEIVMEDMRKKILSNKIDRRLKNAKDY